MPNVKFFFQTVSVCDQLKKLEPSLTKQLVPNVVLIKWSQDWGLDLCDPVVQEVQRRVGRLLRFGADAQNMNTKCVRSNGQI
jgi:hypothetical protein